MTVLTRSNNELLEQLIDLAGGDPETVHRALRELNEKPGQAPTLEAVVRRILEIKDERDRSAAVK